MRPQNTAIRRTSSSAVTSTVRTCRPVRTSQPHQRPVPAPATISCVQTRLRKYLVNSGLDESMPAVGAVRSSNAARVAIVPSSQLSLSVSVLLFELRNEHCPPFDPTVVQVGDRLVDL